MTEQQTIKSKQSTSSYLAEFLKFCRVREEISAAALSKAIGKSASYIAKIESGQMDPSIKAFARMTIVLKMSSAEVNILIRMATIEEPK